VFWYYYTPYCCGPELCKSGTTLASGVVVGGSTGGVGVGGGTGGVGSGTGDLTSTFLASMIACVTKTIPALFMCNLLLKKLCFFYASI